MEQTDTIKLLKECDAGTKMAVTSIDDVLELTEDTKLKSILSESKQQHETLGDTLHRVLSDLGAEDQEPAGIAKTMAAMKTNMKLAMHNTDSTIADLITDGCDMGIKSLYRYKNQYSAADSQAKELCMQIIGIEEQLRADLRRYL